MLSKPSLLDVRRERGVGELHDRMPIILAENGWPKWLGEQPARV